MSPDLNPIEHMWGLSTVGTFDPDNMDPVELLSKLEKVVDVYSVPEEDACRLLMICIPRSLTSVLLQEVCDKRADRGARREALLMALFHCVVRLGSARLVTARLGLRFHRSLVPL